MSRENVERIRRGHGVISQSGWDSEDAQRIGTEMLHPDVEWHDQRELPGATVHQGVEEVERHLAAAQEALEYEAMDLLEVLDGDPCVVAVYRVRARGRASGVPVERDAVYVYRFRGPKIERVDIYGTRAEALEAAGLSG
jgi:ketosteroid isomerase-like protein